jgi:hypothetical protein
MAGIERTVVLGLMSYIGEDGMHRYAQSGAIVRVHSDHIERFDRLNVLQGQAPAVEPVSEPSPPKPRSRTRKED